MNKKIISLLFIIIFLIGASIGFFIGKSLNIKYNDNICNNQRDEYKIKWDKLQDNLKKNDMIQGLSDDIEYKSITGIVKSINNNTIVIESKLLRSFLDPSLDERYIELDSNTRIKMIVRKSEEEIANELKNAEQQGIETSDSPNGGISYYKSEDVSIDQIQNGDLITINSDKNIKNEKSIKAIEIYFERK